jgi:hypothetical protein
MEKKLDRSKSLKELDSSSKKHSIKTKTKYKGYLLISTVRMSI